MTGFLPHLPLIILFPHFAIIESMFGHETRPYHFLIPTVIVIIGGIFAHIRDWEYVGYFIWIVAGLNSFFLVYTAVKDKQLDRIREEHEHYATIITLDAAKTTTKVVIDKTAIEGNLLSQSFATLQIAPSKMKIFAEQSLKGKKLAIREWTPIKDGKLFSDGEWRRLIAFMKQPVPDRKDIKFIEQINPKDERQGFEWTNAGTKWLENIVDAYAVHAL